MKLGFIGAGFIARFQSVAIRQVRGLEVAGILKRRGAEALAGYCREHRLGDAKIYGSIAELARNVDVVALYVPNYCRVEVMEEIAAAVKSGAKLKGVIVDKPLARNMKEARRMVELVREAKLLTAYFENQVFMKAIQSQRAQLLPVAQTMGPLTLTRSAEEHGVDYAKTPAEDFATGMITYRNPETGQIVKSQFTDSWMFEKQGLRLFMDGMGPGYAFEINTLVSPLNVFIGDVAAEEIADQESALEKATASRGLLAVQYNEADLYGYTDENQDMLESFSAGRNAMLSWEYGLEIQRLVMASYLSAERGRTIDLTDQAVLAELDSYVPAIQQGKGAAQLLHAG